MKKLLILLLLLSPLVKAVETDKISKGISNFLVERANANALYTFEKTLLSNNLLKCLLPETYATLQIISTAGIFSTQLTNKEIWEKKLKEDFKTLPRGLLSLAYVKDQNLECNKIKGFSATSLKGAKYDGFETKMAVYTSTTLTNVFDEKKQSNESLTLFLLELMTQVANDNPELLTNSTYVKTTKYILFFAELADASDDVEVTNILKTYTLPPVSYYKKREAGRHLMVTSYLGVNVNLGSDDFGMESDSDINVFAPIGLEYTFGWWNRSYIDSLSIMIAPVDFGYPISLKLNGIEEDVELDELIAPSITISAGAKDIPLTYGVGFQSGAKIRNTNQEENRVFLFIAFDMPLMDLF